MTAERTTRHELLWIAADALMESDEQCDTEWALADAKLVIDAIWPVILRNVQLIGRARGELLRTELEALDTRFTTCVTCHPEATS